MGGFNVNYNSTEIYIDSEDSGYKHEDIDMTLSVSPIQSNITKYNDKLTVNSSRPKEESNFDTLCSSCIASKQTGVVI